MAKLDDRQTEKKLNELKRVAVQLCESAREAMPLIYGKQKRPLGIAINDFMKTLKQLHLDED